MIDPGEPPPARGRPRGEARGRAFDRGGPEPALLDACVHCGFCLPTCPTYALWGEEMDSPRGRLDLMALAREDGVGLTAAMVRHFDSCLGCLACVTACPSGVRYDLLLASTRDQVERRFLRPWDERLHRWALFAVLPSPVRLRAAIAMLGLARRAGVVRAAQRTGLWDRLPPSWRVPVELMPPTPPRARATARPRRPRSAAPRLRVALLTGCVQRTLYGSSNARAARVLAACGAEVWVPPGQGCCGALEIHGGRRAAARGRVRRLIQALDRPGVDRIAVTAAGCGSALRACPELFDRDPAWAERARSFAGRVRDVTEVLHELGPPPEGLCAVPRRVAYHDACHLAHGQGVRAAPRAVLGWVPGLELVELAEPDLCCGSAGIFNLTDPAAARALGERKAASVVAARPDLVVAANPGCQLQIAAALRACGRPVPVVQPVDVLAWALGPPTAAAGFRPASAGWDEGDPIASP